MSLLTDSRRVLQAHLSYLCCSNNADWLYGANRESYFPLPANFFSVHYRSAPNIHCMLSPYEGLPISVFSVKDEYRKMKVTDLMKFHSLSSLVSFFFCTSRKALFTPGGCPYIRMLLDDSQGKLWLLFKEFNHQFQFLKLKIPIQVAYFQFVALARHYSFFLVC